MLTLGSLPIKHSIDVELCRFAYWMVFPVEPLDADAFLHCSVPHGWQIEVDDVRLCCLLMQQLLVRYGVSLL